MQRVAVADALAEPAGQLHGLATLLDRHFAAARLRHLATRPLSKLATPMKLLTYLLTGRL